MYNYGPIYILLLVYTGGRNGEPKDKIDYELQHYVVTIPAGQRTSAHLTIDIYDDDIVEPHIEYYHLTISNSSLPDRVSIRNVPTAQIDIRDDDGKYYSLLVVYIRS